LLKNPFGVKGKRFLKTVPGNVIPAEAGIQFSLADTFIQIIPGWVIFFNQFQFPDPFPSLYLFFSLESRFPRFMNFIPNQTMNAVFPGETINQIIFMFVYTLNKVRRHPCIQSAISFAAKNVNVKYFQIIPLDSRFCGNDGMIQL
jgi:hypothetical protein